MTKSKRKINSSLGGKKTLERNGSDYFSNMAEQAHAKRKLKLQILESFTVGDLENPVTLKSIKDKLEQIENV